MIIATHVLSLNRKLKKPAKVLVFLKLDLYDINKLHIYIG